MDTHWRNTQKQARFFSFDARSAFAIFLFLIHMSLWTFGIAFLTMLIFWFVERRGFTFDAALRGLRAWLLGPRRPAILRELRRHWVDFG